MTQYNNLNVKLSNSRLNKLKSGIKNEIEVVLTLYRAHYEILPQKFQFLNFSASWNKYKVKMSKIFSYLMVFSLFFNLLHLCNIARQRLLNGQFFKGAHILSLHIFTAKTA